MADDAGTTPEVHHQSLELRECGDPNWPDFSIRAKVEGFSFNSQPVEIARAEPLQVEGGVRIVREHLRHMVAASIYCRDVDTDTLEEAAGNLRTPWKDMEKLEGVLETVREELSKRLAGGDGEGDLIEALEAVRDALDPEGPLAPAGIK